MLHVSPYNIYHICIIYVSYMYHIFIIYLSYIYHIFIIYLSYIYHIFIIYLSYIYHIFITYLSYIYHIFIIYLSLITIQPQNQPNPGIKWYEMYIKWYKYASHVVTTRFEPCFFFKPLLYRSLCTLFRRHGMTYWDFGAFTGFVQCLWSERDG